MKPEDMIKIGIPAELHGDASLAEIPDAAALARSYVETKKLVGGSIRIPTKDAGDEAVKAFKAKIKEAVPDLVEVPTDPAKLAEAEGFIFEKLGRPKEAKEYPALKDAGIIVPPEIKLDEEKLRATAHVLGFTKKQFATFAKGVLEEQIKLSALESDARKALKLELADAFDDRLLAAAHAAKQMGANEEFQTRIRTGNVPIETAKQWIAVAKSIGVQGSNFSPEGGGSGKMSPAEAVAAIAELRSNPDLLNKSSPRQMELAKRLVALHEIAYPEKK